LKIIISEQQRKSLSKDYSDLVKPLEMVLNQFMSKKYSWWKGIQIISIYTTKSVTLFESILEVPEEWGEKKWEEFNYDKYFPKNDAWEVVDADEGDYVSLSAIISTHDGEEIREDLSRIWKLLTGETSNHISLNPIMLKFV